MNESKVSSANNSAAQIKFDTQSESLNMIINIVHRWKMKEAGASLREWKNLFRDATRKDKTKAQVSAIMRAVAKRIVELGVNHNLDMALLKQLVGLFSADDSMSSAMEALF